MKIFIDWLKKAITKIEHDSELYVGNQFSNKFDVYFFNVGTDTDWFPTLTQLAPNGREAGPFSPDSDSFTTTTIDNVTYLTATFTMGTGYAFIKGVSSFFLYENRITTPHQTKSVIGKFIVTLNNSDNGYFIDDPEFNPKVKEYVDKYSQLRFGGEASTSVIEALESNQGVWLATDTGYYWYWDYDNNEYVRGNLFQAVSVADNSITKNKLASAVRNEIDNKVNNGENNDDGSISTETVIQNTNANQEDTDGTYGAEVRLNYRKGKLSTFESAGATEREAKVETEAALGEGYRVLIEVNDDNEYISKIKVLKNLIELISDGKLTLTAKTGVAITSGDDTNEIEGDINIETKYGGITIETDTDHELTIISGGGINLRDDTYIVNSNLHVDREIYENNKRVSTKEYVLQREAYLQRQIDDIEIQTNVVKQSDIADNLNTDDATKVLSASQGVVLKGLIDNINTLLQSDDTTLDEIQEIVDYIKNNKSLIDGITTSKVSVSDIINNLTTTATNKPLSANQGKVLKDLIDGLQTSVSAINEYKPYEVQLSDITITGTSSPYPVTLSSALETAVLSGKRALFVNGTIMNTLTQGSVTTDTLFNNISYDKYTQIGYKHIIAFSNYIDNPLSGLTTLSAVFLQDDNNQWHIMYASKDIDTEYLQTQITNLDTRVTTLENSGGSLYQHNLILNNSQKYILLSIINNSSTQMDLEALGTFLLSNSFTSNTNLYPANGADYSNSKKKGYYGAFAFTATSIRIRYCDFADGTAGDEPVGSAFTITDNITQIS